MFKGNEEIYPQTIRHVNVRFDQHIPTQFFMNSYDAETDPIPPSQPRRRFFYTACAYILDSRAAQILVDIVDKFGFIKPADIMVMKLLDLVNGSYTASPLLAKQPLAPEGLDHPVDSDIQHDKSRIRGHPDA